MSTPSAFAASPPTSPPFSSSVRPTPARRGLVATFPATLAALLCATAAPAATIEVPGDQPTLQAAVNAAVDGDVIVLAPGAYPQSAQVVGKEIDILGATGDPDDILLAGNGTDIPLRVIGDAVVFVDALTIATEGATQGVFVDGVLHMDRCVVAANAGTNGGGISMIGPDTTVTLTDCLVAQNVASARGGAVYVTGNATLIAQDCIFEDNDAAQGTIHVFSGFADLDRCVLRDNDADEGSAFYSQASGDGTIDDSVLEGNDGEHPLYVGGTLKLVNVTSDRNTSTTAGLARVQGNLTLTNVIARDPADLPLTIGGGSTSAEYSNLQNGPAGVGVIDADPVYIGSSLRLDAGSPGIDAGDASSASALDLDGDPRVLDDGNIPDTGAGATPYVDMGAYERFSRIRYVDDDAAPGGDGRGWATAYRDLQDALDEADAVGIDVNEIWIAVGTYRPDRGTGDRDATFTMRGVLDIRGSYDGNEILRDETAGGLASTFLSGQIGGLGDTDNTRHVVTAINVNAGGRLSRVTIRDGFATGPGPEDGVGGAIRVVGGAPRFTDLIIRDCSADGSGHAVHATDSSLRLERVRFLRNGLDVDGNATAWFTGGAPSLRHCLFLGNESAGDATLTIRDGAVGTVDLCTIVHNTSDGWAAGLLGFQADVTANNSIFYRNFALDPVPGQPLSRANFFAADINWCTVGELPNEYSGNNADDPGFADIDGADDIPGTLDDDLFLAPGSPLIDSGNNELVPAGTAVDLAGNDRFRDDTGTDDTGVGDAPVVDRGVYEFQGTTVPGPPEDLDGDGIVGFGDLLIVLSAFGPCDDCDADFDGDGQVGFSDLLALLTAWS